MFNLLVSTPVDKTKLWSLTNFPLKLIWSVVWQKQWLEERQSYLGWRKSSQLQLAHPYIVSLSPWTNLAFIGIVVCTSVAGFVGQRKRNNNQPRTLPLLCVTQVWSLLWITDKLVVSNNWFTRLSLSPMLKIWSKVATASDTWRVSCSCLLFLNTHYSCAILKLDKLDIS